MGFPVSIADGRTQAGLRVHVDVVVYRRDPTMYGRMIVLSREAKSETQTLVTVELDPPAWRLKGIARHDRPAYEMRLEVFDALELWTEAEWAGVGPARMDAVAAAGLR
jgi:hypothetical protein